MTTATITPGAGLPEHPAGPPTSARTRRAAFWVVAALLVLPIAWGVHALVAKPGINTANPQSWLPKQQLDHPVDLTVTGTEAHPGLTVNGDYIKVETPTFSTLATVNGPVVPGEGLPVVQGFTTCTWTISLGHVKGTVPISLADFDSIDAQQTVFKMTLVPGQPTLPTSIHTGQSLSFQVRAVMPTGEGLMRWAPDGNNIVAKWDYQVEND